MESMQAFWDLMHGGVGVLLSRLVLDLGFTFLVVRGVYTRLYHRRDYAFTYLLLNLVTFSLSFVLSQVRVDLGFAMGLFAVFGILRYRTESIEVRNLTYLFVVIGLAVLNALVTTDVSLWELLLVNSVIVGMVAWLESASFAARGVAPRGVRPPRPSGAWTFQRAHCRPSHAHPAARCPLRDRQRRSAPRHCRAVGLLQIAGYRSGGRRATGARESRG